MSQTVNSEHYGRMLCDYFWREIEDYNRDDMWFQKDGGTGHTRSSSAEETNRTCSFEIEWYQLAHNILRLRIPVGGAMYMIVFKRTVFKHWTN